MKTLKFTLRAWPAVFIASVAVLYATREGARLMGIDLPEQSQVELMRQYAGWNLTFALLVLQVVALIPVAEEVLFRFLLFRLPSLAWRGGACMVAIASSALFSAAHYVDYARLAKGGGFAFTGWSDAFLALGFFGLAQCWLYRRTGRLWAAMLNHALFNLTNLAFLFVG